MECNKKGLIRVGRCVYNGNNRTDPSFEGFTPIIVLTKTSEYGDLGPYVLKDDHGRIMENIWQSSKVYASVPNSSQPKNRYDKTIVWKWPAEKHVNIDEKTKHIEILPSYIKWRKALSECGHPIRYPVGYQHRHKCLFVMAEDDNGKLITKNLGIPESREKVYAKVYIDLVKKKPLFHKLKERLNDGENLLIIEVDGPHEESLQHYKDKYNVDDDFIQNKTILANEKNLTIMLNDSLHSYGHGYCLAAALLDLDIKAN